MENPTSKTPPGVAVQYHAHIAFDILKRSMFIPDELLDAQIDKIAFVQEKINQLASIMLSADVGPRITIAEVHGQTIKDGDKTISGRYIELRLPVGKMPTILGVNDNPLGNVVIDGMMPAVEPSETIN